MIYLVTNNLELFSTEYYQIVSVEKSLSLLESIRTVGLDTETTGLDCWTENLKLLQLGNYEFQIVIDCTTVDVSQYKEYLESDRTFLGWNLKFDLKFLYRHKIYPKNVYDGFLVEKLLWLGYPLGMHSMSLKSAAYNYMDIDLDKTVRGKIIWAGLTSDVIIYAANDVKYLEKIILEQWKKVLEKNLQNAVKTENLFVLPLAYTEYCGIRIDKDKWQIKIDNDNKLLEECRNKLNEWVISNYPDDKRFVEINLQGDLFTGFDDTPKCIINWDSPKQVIPLFESLGFNLNVKDKKTGTVKKSVEAKIIYSQRHISPIADLFVNYGRASKTVSTYGDNFFKQINSVSGRIHTNYNQLGADTSRITSGGKDGKTEYINLLNLPADEMTRSCFIAEEGNKWISIDYKGQETYLMASISNDQAILKELNEGSGDIHSLTAFISYSEIPRDTPIKEIKSKYHNLRQEAKGIEFSINYGGNADTISMNKGIPIEEANRIYNSYMSGFKGLKKYQDFRRRDWWDKGYILLNPITQHKAFIYDYNDLLSIKEKMKEPGYWDRYREKKASGCWDDPQVKEVRHFFKRKADSEKQSINYPIQATGSQCLRFALIYFFEYLRKNNLFDKVKICVIPYDEINCEAPSDIANEVADKLYDCMIEAGKIFCKKCKLDAEISYTEDNTLPSCWIH